MVTQIHKFIFINAINKNGSQVNDLYYNGNAYRNFVRNMKKYIEYPMYSVSYNTYQVKLAIAR